MSAQYLTFSAAGSRLAAALSDVVEVLALDALTGVPAVPASVLGVACVRERPVVALDVARRLGLGWTARDARTCLLVVRARASGEDAVVGLVVRDVQALDEGAGTLQPLPAMLGGQGALFRGVLEVEAERALVLDVDAVLAAEDVPLVERMSGARVEVPARLEHTAAQKKEQGAPAAEHALPPVRLREHPVVAATRPAGVVRVSPPVKAASQDVRGRPAPSEQRGAGPRMRRALESSPRTSAPGRSEDASPRGLRPAAVRVPHPGRAGVAGARVERARDTRQCDARAAVAPRRAGALHTEAPTEQHVSVPVEAAARTTPVSGLLLALVVLGLVGVTLVRELQRPARATTARTPTTRLAPVRAPASTGTTPGPGPPAAAVTALHTPPAPDGAAVAAPGPARFALAPLSALGPVGHALPAKPARPLTPEAPRVAAPPSASAPLVEWVEHEVQPGDTLWKLAQRYRGQPLHWPTLYADNATRLSSPHSLVPGQRLRVRRLGPTTPASTLASGAMPPSRDD